MSSRVLSLAAGSLPEAGPVTMVEAAAAGGWQYTGLWVEPGKNWTDTTTAEVREALTRTGIKALDVEVIWIHPGEHDSDHDRILAWGAEVGARAALVVSSEPDPARTRRRYEQLCRRAEAEGIRAVLEFLPITEVKTLADARTIVEDVAHPAGGILIDPLHLARTGGEPADIAEIDPRWLPYAQFCDGLAHLADPTFERILADAIDGRDVPGAGTLPLDALLRRLPSNLPLSFEIRSLAWRERHQNPFSRAAALFAASMRWIRNFEGKADTVS